MNESQGIYRIRDFLLYGDTDKESYEAIKPRIYEYNRMMGMIFGLVATLLVSVMYITASYQGSLTSSKPVYGIGIICSVILVIVSLFAKRNPRGPR